MTKLKPTVEKVRVDGVSLFCRHWGQRGPTLLLIHGATGYGGAWSVLADGFADDYRLLAPDLRGHGDSDQPPTGYTARCYAQDLVGLLRELQLDEVAVAGSSLGGNVALTLAAEHPELVDRLVLLDPACAMPPARIESGLAQLRQAPRVFPSPQAAVALQRALPGRQRWEEAFLPEYVEGNLRRRADGRYEWKWSLAALEQTYAGFREDFWPLAARVRCRTLLLRGVESDVLSEQDALKLGRTIPRCDLIHIVESGHSILFENTRAVLAAIWTFFETP